MIAPARHGRRPEKRRDARITGPDSLLRSVVLQALREANDEGLSYTDLEALIGPDVDRLVNDLRARGHCIQTVRPNGGRVTLHTP